MKRIDKFTKAYLIAALWSSNDDNEEPLDSKFTIENITKEHLEDAIKDCKDFQQKFKDLLEKAINVKGYSLEIAGNDYWLTRNHHGTGFWDRGLGSVGEELTKESHNRGENVCFVCDNEICFSNLFKNKDQLKLKL